MQPSDSPYGVSREDEYVVQVQIPQGLPVFGHFARKHVDGTADVMPHPMACSDIHWSRPFPDRYSELLPSSGERIGYLSNLDFQMPVGYSQVVENVADLTELADVEDVVELTELAELTPVQMLANLDSDQVIQLCFHRVRWHDAVSTGGHHYFATVELMFPKSC